MEVNLTMLGQVMFVWIFLQTALIYHLAQRKTQTPVIATVIGFLLSLLPPIGLIYLVVLVLKNDIKTKPEKKEAVA